MIDIRPFSKHDRRDILRLLIQLQDHIARLDKWKLLKPEGFFDAETYLRETFKSVQKNEGKIFVAESEERLVGFIIGIIFKPNKIDIAEFYPVKRGTIIELAVDKQFRRKGIGALLMKRIEEYFFSKHCKIADVKCFAPNKLAYSFYRKRGYTDRSLLLAKNLQDSRINHQ